MLCRRVAAAVAAEGGCIVWPAAGEPAADARPGGRADDGTPPPADLPDLLDQAKAQGMAAGEARAEERWRARWEAGQAQAAKLAAEAITWKARLRREAEKEMLALALAIARRILRREVQLDAGVLSGILKAALDRCDEREEIVVRVARAEAPTLAQRLEREGLAVRFRLEADPAAPPGSLWIETASGSIDAAPEAQLAEIERGLADRLSVLRPAGGA